jgi:negative regulator of genetic competence, sporulation and motility
VENIKKRLQKDCGKANEKQKRLLKDKETTQERPRKDRQMTREKPRTVQFRLGFIKLYTILQVITHHFVYDRIKVFSANNNYWYSNIY